MLRFIVVEVVSFSQAATAVQAAKGVAGSAAKGGPDIAATGVRRRKNAVGVERVADVQDLGKVVAGTGQTPVYTRSASC